MHPHLAKGRVAIYARYSSDLQRETSIDDQVRRARDAIKEAGGDPAHARLFSDSAISGATLARPGFETLMRAVRERRVDAIVTEDISRISRDFVDAANVFKELQYLDVPLIGLSDGIDTSAKHAKLSFTLKSLVCDLYLDDLRDKTLRGLEGRMLAGFATGLVPYGYDTVPIKDRRGTIAGNKVVIVQSQARIVCRVFERYRDGWGLQRIARALNRDGIPSPRVGTRHKCFGWGAGTIRAILYNERYAGTWRFKERQWVKVPGSNKRRPRPRPANEVMTAERPELRIVDHDLWAEVRVRLAAIRRIYTRHTRESVAHPKTTHLLSGILVCDACGAPMTIYGSTHSYYRCSTAHTKGTCASVVRIREDDARRACVAAIRNKIHTAGTARILRDGIRGLRDKQASRASIDECKQRIDDAEAQMKRLTTFIAKGGHSEFVATTLRELEAQVRADRAALVRLEDDARGSRRLPTVEEIVQAARRLDRRLAGDVASAKCYLQRCLKNGEMRVRAVATGVRFQGNVMPLALAMESTLHDAAGVLVVEVHAVVRDRRAAA